MTNAQIAKLLGQIATLLEMDGANPFRVRAYRDGARVIETLPEPAAQLAQTEGRLQQVKGIGKDLEVRIRDLVATGSTGVYDELTKKFPASLVELTEIPGLGPKRVKLLFDALGIRGRDDLAAAARTGRLREVKGLGETVEAKLLKYLEREAPAGPSRLLLHGAWQVAHDLAAAIAATPGVERVELAGSFRRRKETIGDLDLVVCGGAADGVMTAFTTHAYVAEVLARGETRSSVKLGNGLQVDLRHVPAPSFGAAMLYFTGSKAHNIELRKLAIARGWSLNEYGLTEGERVVAARTEEDIYRALGLAYVPPELREGLDEVARARDGTLPKLVDLADLCADLHMHSDRSDGRDTLADMVRAARDHGYEYCAITEHSKAIGMLKGFDDERVLRSAGEIDQVRREVPGIRVLYGLEVDILADGALDLGDAALDALDWVVISLHASLSQPREAVTQRVLRALDHPAVCVMGHPSGRKIGAREGADLDWERVFERAAERGVAMELNAQPDRVDLNDVNARLAKAKGLSFCIDTDAHATDALGYMRYGVFQARRAGLTAGDVLNTRPFEAFERWRRAKKQSASAPVAPVKPARPKSVAAKPAVAKPAAAKPKLATPKPAAKPKRAPARRGSR